MNGFELFDRFSKLLIDNGMNKSDFCKITGIKQTALSNWSNRGTMPSADLAIAIANCFDVSVDYVLGNSDIPNPTSHNDYSDSEIDMIKAYRTLDENAKRQLALMLAFLKDQNNKK